MLLLMLTKKVGLFIAFLDKLSRIYSDLAPSRKVTGGERQKAKAKRQKD
jgi:hypothetical protein